MALNFAKMKRKNGGFEDELRKKKQEKCGRRID